MVLFSLLFASLGKHSNYLKRNKQHLSCCLCKEPNGGSICRWKAENTVPTKQNENRVCVSCVCHTSTLWKSSNGRFRKNINAFHESSSWEMGYGTDTSKGQQVPSSPPQRCAWKHLAQNVNCFALYLTNVHQTWLWHPTLKLLGWKEPQMINKCEACL